MVNYLQLGRNLRRFAQRAESQSATYIYNAKGIYDFKKMNPQIKEELTNTFRGVENPVLEISVKKAKRPAGVITVKDGEKELSADTFVLNEGENIEDYLPKTNGCVKKFIFDKAGIEQIGEQYGLLKKFLDELTKDLAQPNLEFWIKDKNKYTIGNMVLRDGDREVTRGYFSRTNNVQVPVEKFHFINEKELITGYGIKKDIFSKIFERLPQKLQKRLWLLDERAKSMVRSRYGVSCSPKTPDQIAQKWKLTGARVRSILNSSMAKIRQANTYSEDLCADLDNLGHILSESERYKIYNERNSYDINIAGYKIIKHKMDLLKQKK